MKHKYDFEPPRPKPLEPASPIRRMTLQLYKKQAIDDSDKVDTNESVNLDDSDDDNNKNVNKKVQFLIAGK